MPMSFKSQRLFNWLSWCLLVLSTYLLALPSQATEQCFLDSQSAYQYLLQQENTKKTAKQPTVINHKINPNIATEAELTQLKGIGSKKAQAIIHYRETMGRFTSVDELVNVKGIGNKTVDKNRMRLTVDD